MNAANTGSMLMSWLYPATLTHTYCAHERAHARDSLMPLATTSLTNIYTMLSSQYKALVNGEIAETTPPGNVTLVWRGVASCDSVETLYHNKIRLAL